MRKLTGPIAVHRLWKVAPTLEAKVPDVRHYRRLFLSPVAEWGSSDSSVFIDAFLANAL